MKCLLVAATYAEVAPAVEFLKYSAHAERMKQDWDVLVGGVGMLSTAFRLTRHIALRRPDFIVQAGIAGCFDRTVPLGKVYAVQSEALADMGVWEQRGWQDVFDMGFAKKSAPPFSGGRLINPHKLVLRQSKLPRARAVTVNQISTGKKNINAIAAHYRPLLESMEGAALHYVALQEQTPFLQIRGVSNYVGERNKARWQTTTAIFNLNTELLRVFETL